MSNAYEMPNGFASARGGDDDNFCFSMEAFRRDGTINAYTGGAPAPALRGQSRAQKQIAGETARRRCFPSSTL